MFQAQFPRATEARRGVILMVVLILLTLFAIVGLSFALYASSEAQIAQLDREAQVPPLPDTEAELLFSYFLGQYLYDVNDDVTGVYSALRGHSLARTMYGYNYKRSSSDTAFVSPNTVPFNGLGRLHTPQPGIGATNPFNVDDYNLINYTFFSADSFLRDPERPGFRTDLSSQQPLAYLGGFNAPYTYPDLNNMFLAAVKADGTVLMPSFHRPWLFGRLTDIPNVPSRNPGNPNWTSPQGKYLTLRPRPVDMSPRFPYPEDEGGDVKNLVGSPGYFDPVSGQLCNNDSIWIDLGYPVMTAADGRKFKPLFAPLIMDLDNRVNLNIHGNIRGRDNNSRPKKTIHLSNQGWGPWEVNLGKVLNALNPNDPSDNDVAHPKEWINLFGGLKDPNSLSTQQLLLQRGRYGVPEQSSQGPYAHPHAPWAPNRSLFPRTPAPFYSPVDFDATNDSITNLYGASGPITPPAADLTKFTCFPSYPPSDYQGNSGTGLLIERTDHPSLYNYFQPSPEDRRRFLSSNMEALLRYSDTGSLALTSELFRLCPANFSGPGSERRRGLVTTRSFDVDRPGVTPWAIPGSYKLQTGDPFPNRTAIPIPGSPQLNKGEYGPDGRASDAFYGRLNLNRDLPPYPKPADNGRIAATDLPQFNLAQTARQQLAKEIFDRLRFVTTGDTRDILVAFPPAAAAANVQEFNAMRWLAQLAVNIVDYIDSDDYITPFNWYPIQYGTTHPTGDWVYGTELPRLVINEAYIECDNDPSVSGANSAHWFNFWVELHNPFNRDPNLPDSVSPRDSTLQSAARLRMPPHPGKTDAYGIYQLQIAKTPNALLQSPDNTQGFPDPQLTPTGQVVRIVSDFTSADPNKQSNVTDVVLASNGSYKAPVQGQNVNGFYVLGPDYAPGFPGVGPAFETLRVKESGTGPILNSMSYKLPSALSKAQLLQLPSFGLFLQRLACPHLPPNPPAGSPANTPPVPGAPYNPYITVDYIESVKAYDGAKFSSDESGGHAAPDVSLRFSLGRRQPYAANRATLKPQKPNPPGQPHNTFFSHNGETDSSGNPKPSTNLANPFDWLIHLDRPLISPMELLNVSAFKPHELTQRFVLSQGGLSEQHFQHRLGLVVASPQSRIYRLFELLEAGPQALGTAAGGRVPGKININTIWDGETLLALCDPQMSNNFSLGLQVYDPTTPFNPTTLFGAMVTSRTPGLPMGRLDMNDRPFRGMAAPFTAAGDKQYPSGIGINDTLLRSSTSGLLFGVRTTADQNPFLQYEVLNKIYNQLTTRSNVFAVWLTVGFFEVVQDTDAAGNPIRPVKLGAEIGKAENRNIRHRMFAIVDRTNLSTLANVTRLQTQILGSPPGQPPRLQSARVASLAGVTASPPFPIGWSIKVGSSVTIEDGANSETVMVQAVDPTTKSITAIFQRSHANLTWISLGDTPGPPPIFLSSLPLESFKGIIDTNPTNVPIQELSGQYEDLPWSIQAGDWLVVDTGANEEAVQVLGVNPGDPSRVLDSPPSFQAKFTKPHASPLTIRFPNARPGNPGPQFRFNPRDPAAAPIVRYFSIIE